MVLSRNNVAAAFLKQWPDLQQQEEILNDQTVTLGHCNIICPGTGYKTRGLCHKTKNGAVVTIMPSSSDGKSSAGSLDIIHSHWKFISQAYVFSISRYCDICLQFPYSSYQCSMAQLVRIWVTLLQRSVRSHDCLELRVDIIPYACRLYSLPAKTQLNISLLALSLIALTRMSGSGLNRFSDTTPSLTYQITQLLRPKSASHASSCPIHLAKLCGKPAIMIKS